MEYPKYLNSVADQIVGTDGDRLTAQLQGEANGLQEISQRLLGRLQEMQESDDPDSKRYAEIRGRILQRRDEFTRQLREAVDTLAGAKDRG